MFGRSLITLGLILWSTLAFAQAPRYTVQALGAFGVFAVNEQHLAVGSQGNQAVLSDGGMLTVLGLLPGAQMALARGITQRHVVGYNIPGVGGTMRAFLWTPQQGLRDLGGLPGYATAALAINGAETVAGYASLGSQPARPVLWIGGQVLDLGTLGGPQGAATAINEDGDAAGQSQLGGGSMSYHATLWPVDGPPVDMDTLGSTFSIALGLSGGRLAVGYVQLGDVQRAFAWCASTGMELLLPLTGDVRSAALGVNDAGLVVGRSGRPSATSPFDVLQAALWVEGVPVALTAQLDTPGWVLGAAVAINQDGRIVANGTYQGQPQVALLTPVPERVAARLARQVAREAAKAAKQAARLAGR